MTIQNKTILITGANRGIGKAYAEVFLKAGAKKIYLGVRDPASVADFVKTAPDKLIPLKLDVTNKDQIKAAAKAAPDVQILINNAGIFLKDDLISGSDTADYAMKQMEVNYIGPLLMTQAFAPVLKNNGGGVNVIVSSIVGHVVFPGAEIYSASKFAAHALIIGARANLASQGTKVIGVYPGPIETDMAKEIPMEKTSPETVAEKTIEAIEKGLDEVYPDPMAQGLYAAYRADPKGVEAQMLASLQQQQAAA